MWHSVTVAGQGEEGRPIGPKVWESGSGLSANSKFLASQISVAHRHNDNATADEVNAMDNYADELDELPSRS